MMRKDDMPAMNMRVTRDGSDLPDASAAPGGVPSAAAPFAEVGPLEAAWERLDWYRLDPRRLTARRVITATRSDPAHVAFDLLRTRLMQALKARGWRHVAITSPTKGCGKTFVTANLALSLARRASCRTVVMDLDLRLPNLSTAFGIERPGSMQAFLTGERPLEQHLRRLAPNLAVGLNGASVFDSAELLQEPMTGRVLDTLQETLKPDVMLYDLPPTLACDDVLAFLPRVDGVLLVAGGGITSAEDVRRCERLFEGQAPLLGVILNKTEDPVSEPYYG